MAEPEKRPVWEVTRGGGPERQRDGELTDAGPPDGRVVVAALRRPHFPIFSPSAAVPGRRYIHGWRETGGLVTAVELAVNDEAGDTLVVVSSSPRSPWGDLSADDEVLQLVMEVASQPEDLVRHGLDRRSLAMPIGEHLVTFSLATHGRICVLWSVHGPGILVRARNLPPDSIEVVPLDDPGPYIDGSSLDLGAGD